MKLIELLDTSRILVDPAISSKKRLLESAAELIADSTESATRGQIFNSLIARERLGSTGMGKGIALPHGRIEAAGPPRAAFIRLGEPIPYDALDGQPVDLVFCLIVPEGGNEAHLEILAQLAEMFSDEATTRSLREAGSADQVLDTITHWSPNATNR